MLGQQRGGLPFPLPPRRAQASPHLESRMDSGCTSHASHQELATHAGATQKPRIPWHLSCCQTRVTWGLWGAHNSTRHMLISTNSLSPWPQVDTTWYLSLSSLRASGPDLMWGCLQGIERAHSPLCLWRAQPVFQPQQTSPQPQTPTSLENSYTYFKIQLGINSHLLFLGLC